MFKKYKLKNGLRVILAPLHETKAVTVLVLVKVGSRYEKREINGVSHFVEHLMFKGTKKRPTTLDIAKELDGVGAEYNAFTAKDHTGYYVKTSHDKVEMSLDILSDVLFNSKFDQAEVEKERNVIVEEINMYEDNPMMFMEDLFEQTIYGDSPLGWQIAGPKQVIQEVNRTKIVDYYQHYYHPGNMLIAVAGKIDKTIINLIKKYFGNIQTKAAASTYKKIKIVQAKPRVKLKYKQTEQVQLALGFPAYSYFDQRIYPLYLLGIIMGGGMSSRLFISIREQKGLCYFIRTGVNVYQDTGNFVVQAGLDKTRIKQAIKQILNELHKVTKQGVTAKELRKAKDFLKGKLILDLEASDHVASWLSKQELLRNKILTPAEQIRRLEKVTVKEVKKISAEIIKSKRINLALIGPYKRAGEFSSLLKI